jgi:murein hydrolase activator
VGVQFIPGYQNMVIVQHGAYYTVYSNLESLSVSKGDEVAAGQAIGKLGSDDLHFEVWREKQRLNPAGWLR